MERRLDLKIAFMLREPGHVVLWQGVNGKNFDVFTTRYPTEEEARKALEGMINTVYLLRKEKGKAKSLPPNVWIDIP